MDGVLPHDGVVFFQLHTARRVLAVLLRDVTRSTGQAAGFMFCAFEDNLDTIPLAFLCHLKKRLNLKGGRVSSQFPGDKQSRPSSPIF